MIVGMWMARNLFTVEPETSITEAAALMSARRVRRLPVTKGDKAGAHLVGIVSATDLFRAFPKDLNPFSPVAPDTPPARITVGEVMSTSPITTTPQAPIEEAAREMRERTIGALPVLHDGILAGLITESDIFRAFISLFDSPLGGARVTFDISKGEDAFRLLASIAAQREVRVISLNHSEQDGRRVCVVRVAGRDLDRFLDQLWKSGHPLLNVLRMS